MLVSINSLNSWLKINAGLSKKNFCLLNGCFKLTRVVYEKLIPKFSWPYTTILKILLWSCRNCIRFQFQGLESKDVTLGLGDHRL